MLDWSFFDTAPRTSGAFFAGFSFAFSHAYIIAHLLEKHKGYGVYAYA